MVVDVFPKEMLPAGDKSGSGWNGAIKFWGRWRDRGENGGEDLLHSRVLHLIILSWHCDLKKLTIITKSYITFSQSDLWSGYGPNVSSSSVLIDKTCLRTESLCSSTATQVPDRAPERYVAKIVRSNIVQFSSSLCCDTACVRVFYSDLATDSKYLCFEKGWL